MEEINFLLSFPPFWTPLFICLFLNKSYDLLDELQGKEEVFLHKLNSKAKRENVFEIHNEVREGWILPQIDQPFEKRKGWANALSEEEFGDLTAFHQKGKKNSTKKPHQYNTNCILGLLKLIRDKYQHRIDLSDDTKDVLGWSRELSSEHNLAAFWTKTFPKLLAFLYINLYEKFKKHDPYNLRAFYCDLVDFQKYSDVIDLPSLLRNLRESLYSVMAKGYLPIRFTGERAHQRTEMNEKSIILEIRQMSAGLLAKLLPKESNCITIVVRKRLLQYFWMDNATKMEYNFCHAMEEANTGVEEYSLIFCNSSEQLNQIKISELSSRCQYSDKVIIFASSEEEFSSIKRDIEKRLGFQFSELPVTLPDFREDKRQQISRNRYLEKFSKYSIPCCQLYEFSPSVALDFIEAYCM